MYFGGVSDAQMRVRCSIGMHERKKQNTHEYDVHGVVLLSFYLPCRPTQIHAESVRNNSYPQSQVRYRVLPTGIA